MKKSYLLFALVLLSSISMIRAQKIDNLIELKQKSQNPLFHRLGKAIETPAFESEGYWSWGSSVVKGDDGKYHMFVSRFPKSLPFHGPYGESATASPMRLLERATVHQGLSSVNWSYVGSAKGWVEPI